MTEPKDPSILRVGWHSLTSALIIAWMLAVIGSTSPAPDSLLGRHPAYGWVTSVVIGLMAIGIWLLGQIDGFHRGWRAHQRWDKEWDEWAMKQHEETGHDH